MEQYQNIGMVMQHSCAVAAESKGKAYETRMEQNGNHQSNQLVEDRNRSGVPSKGMRHQGQKKTSLAF